MNDVFKDMQVKVGCDYLSDLRPGQGFRDILRGPPLAAGSAPCAALQS